MICPKCKEDRAHRARRAGFVDHCVSIAGFYPHSCRACKTRFRAYRRPSSEKLPSTNPEVENEIRATRSARSWKLKQRQILLYCLAFLLFAAILYFLTHEPPAGA